MSNETVCQVCIETFNKSTLKEIKCPYCEYSACAKCTKHYLLQSKENSHCMNCKREWDRDILVERMTKSFVNKEWKQHREDVLVERETSLLPESQIYVEREIEIEKTTKEYLEVQKKIMKWIRKSVELKTKIRKLREKKDTERKQFIKKCPNEECRGFLSTKWKCGICNINVCAECHEIKNDNEHECKKENVETAKMIEKECKSCPKCATIIHKIDGCDLMWCVMCHTAFSWKSGRIESGNIHNPHYFEWLRQNGRQERNPMEIQCGREIDNHFVRVLSEKTKEKGEEVRKLYLEKARKVMHMREVEMRRYQTNRVEENRDLRISFLRNRLSKEEWKKILQKREKQSDKSRGILNIMGMYVNTMTDILYRIQEENEWGNGLEEMERLKEYVKEQYERVKKVYGMTSVQKLVDLL